MNRSFPAQDILVREVSISQLNELSQISIAFEIASILEISPDSEEPGEWIIKERSLTHHIEKDYDAISENHPLDWAEQFDLRNWGLLFAYHGEERIGGALIAYKTPGVDMLEDRDDQAVLWDIRIARAWRGMGAGKALFEAAKEWAINHNCRELKIETQTNNATAVRFYLRQGCRLGRVIPDAYPDLPDEVQVLFYLDLSERAFKTLQGGALCAD